MRYLIFLWWALLAATLVMLHFDYLSGVCIGLVAVFVRLTLPVDRTEFPSSRTQSKGEHRLEIFTWLAGALFLSFAGIFDQIEAAIQSPDNRVWYFLFVGLLVTKVIVSNRKFFFQVPWNVLEKNYDL